MTFGKAHNAQPLNLENELQRHNPIMKSVSYSTSVKEMEGADASSTCETDYEPSPQPVKATKDEKLVRGARVTVAAVLVLSASVVAALAYVLLSQSEYSGFKAQVRIHRIVVVEFSNDRNCTNKEPLMHLMLARSSTAPQIKSSSWPAETQSARLSALKRWHRSTLRLPKSPTRHSRALPLMGLKQWRLDFATFQRLHLFITVHS
jgi:hypothetical protein